MPSPADLPLDRIADLCREYGVTELAIFGSVARGEATASRTSSRPVTTSSSSSTADYPLVLKSMDES